ncbi:MAG TPA: SDR family NAD(P)-dependent oxidoreductase [Blastocatellia bacterium]|nr:SDR family NAD(P)-dependent oxidoreductase [Blastocatellia bacterium]
MSTQPQNFFLTGCASGIGRHLAGVLLAGGHRVFATDINLPALQEYARALNLPETQLRIAKLDVTDPQSWEAAFAEAVEAFGGIDVAANIAGLMIGGWALDAPPELVHRHFDINTKGVIFGTQTAARHMVKRGGGHIINIASLSALAPIPGIAIYSASKYAVRAFSLAVAQELRPHGVYVTAVSPDAVNTPLLDPNKEVPAAALVFSGPRLLTVEEIARVIVKKVLPRRPLEVIIPWHRGWLARLTDAFPNLAFTLGPILHRRGLEKQTRFRGDIRRGINNSNG